MGAHRAAEAAAPRAALLALVAALAAAGVGGDGSCSEGFVRTSPVVFSCAGSGGQVSTQYLALAGSDAKAFTVPKGTADFRVSMTSEGPKADVDLLVYNPASKEYIVRYDTGLVSDAQKRGSLSGAGIRGDLAVEYSGSQAKPEEVAFSGSTPRDLEVQVKNHGIFPVTVTLEYAFGPISDCVEPWVEGCGEYNPFDVQRTVVDWSIWAATVYHTVDHAWSELAGPMTETHQGWPAGASLVPYHKWSYVWKAWPMAEHKGAGWQDVFHWVSKGNEFADKSGFERAFALGRISAAVEKCMAEFHKDHRDEEEAYKLLTQQVQSGSTGAQELVQNCSKASGFEASQLKDFMLGVDGKEGLGREEFQLLWDRLHLCPAGFYRSSPIIINCHASSGRAEVLAGARQTSVVAEIPKGVINLEVSVVSSRDVDLMIFDPRVSTWVVKWEGGVVGRRHPEGEYRGAPVRFSGDDTRGPIYEEAARFRGPLPANLSIQVHNYGSSDAVAVVLYSWDKVEDSACPKVPLGCSALDAKAAKGAVNGLSAWLARTYGSQAEAWQAVQHRYIASDGVSANMYPPIEGVRFMEFEQLWRAWPAHDDAAAPWQAAFHLADTDANGAIDKEEMSMLYRQHRVTEVLDNLFRGLHKRFPDVQQAWGALSKGEAEVKPDRWRETVFDLLERRRLPGGAPVCEKPPEMRPSVYQRSTHLELGRAGQPVKISPAEDLGLVGTSFTVLARIKQRGPAPSSQVGPVLGTPDAIGSRALFAGLRGGKPAMSLRGGEANCQAGVVPPTDMWIDVAWVYDAAAREQRIYLDGSTVKVCQDVDPFQGFGSQVWLGLGPSPAVSWAAGLGSLQLFPAALPGPELRTVFKYTPRWSLQDTANIRGHLDAVDMGTTDDLGFHRSSFTAVLSVFRNSSQENAYHSVYTIMGTPQDNSLEFVVWNGKLGMSFGGTRCASGLVVPKEKWVNVAFVYDAERREQAIYQDGALAKRCGGVDPYDGSGRVIWVGRSGDGIGTWRGRIRDVRVYSHSECGEGIEALASLGSTPLTPARRLLSATAAPPPPPPSAPAPTAGGGAAALAAPAASLAAASPGGGASAGAGSAAASPAKTAETAEGSVLRREKEADGEVAADAFRVVDSNHDGAIQKGEFAHEMEAIIGSKVAREQASGSPAAAEEATAAPATAAEATAAPATAAAKSRSTGGEAEGPKAEEEKHPKATAAPAAAAAKSRGADGEAEGPKAEDEKHRGSAVAKPPAAKTAKSKGAGDSAGAPGSAAAGVDVESKTKAEAPAPHTVGAAAEAAAAAATGRPAPPTATTTTAPATTPTAAPTSTTTARATTTPAPPPAPAPVLPPAPAPLLATPPPPSLPQPPAPALEPRPPAPAKAEDKSKTQPFFSLPFGGTLSVVSGGSSDDDASAAPSPPSAPAPAPAFGGGGGQAPSPAAERAPAPPAPSKPKTQDELVDAQVAAYAPPPEEPDEPDALPMRGMRLFAASGGPLPVAKAAMAAAHPPRPTHLTGWGTSGPALVPSLCLAVALFALWARLRRAESSPDFLAPLQPVE